MRRAYGPRFLDAPDEQAVLADPSVKCSPPEAGTVTATVVDPTGARARQTYYWRVRNARTRHRPESAGQVWHIQPGHPGGAYCDLGHELDPPAHHARPCSPAAGRTAAGGTSRSSGAGALRASGKAPSTPETGSGTVTTRRWRTRTTTVPRLADAAAITTVDDRWAVPRNRSRWAQLIAGYPAGWMDQGAPVVAWRRYRREAHLSPHAGRPRYEIHVTRPPLDRRRRPPDQGALF